jgi:crotonobetainyl-CoA:carnitine CoA-transferase CaiB-like acyl-CoA transferase
MERWGLTEEHVRTLRPDIIYGRMSGFGHSGPNAHYRSYGPVVQAVCGLSQVSGLPGREPSGWGLSYMDNQAAYYNSAGLLMALFARRRTGLGTDVDVSAVEAGIELLGPVLLDVAVNKRLTRRPDFPTGNRLEHPAAAPHGLYPARGDDRWIAIAVFNDLEWCALVSVMGDPAWASEARFATSAGRVANQDALDAHVADWTRDRDRHEMMHALQAVGVRAGAVQDAEDVNEHDPQMAHRSAFFEMDHPVIGPARFEGVPFEADGFAADHWRSGPLLGEDNEYVFTELLGLSQDEYAELLTEGII